MPFVSLGTPRFFLGRVEHSHTWRKKQLRVETFESIETIAGRIGVGKEHKP